MTVKGFNLVCGSAELVGVYHHRRLGSDLTTHLELLAIARPLLASSGLHTSQRRRRKAHTDVVWLSY